ncbi:hypothetical protein HK101_011813 [Irineochytrium annulatum]|nr:hypothetical protein HK101_011813 [Irineochytrium annulatum]
MPTTRADRSPAFNVRIMEKSDRLGMDAASVDVPSSDARMDVPMRSFFPEYYPLLKGLYDSMNIPYVASDNSMSFFNFQHPLTSPTSAFSLPTSYPSRVPAGPAAPSLKVDVGIPAPPAYFSFSCLRIPWPIDNIISLPDLPPLTTLFTEPSRYAAGVVRAGRVVRDYLKLLAQSKACMARGEFAEAKKDKGPLAGVTLGDFLRSNGYSDEFAWDAFVPLFSGVCTCTFETLERFPAVLILEYVATCMPFGRMSFVSCGINTVCDCLAKPVDEVTLRTTVNAITGSPAGGLLVTFTTLTTSRDGRTTATTTTEPFDHVVLATQANQASRILSTSDVPDVDHHALRTVLDRFPYERSLVVCHTDPRLMARDRSTWRCLNFGRRDPSLGLDPSTPTGGETDSAIGADEELVDAVAAADAGCREGYRSADVSMCTHWAQASSPEALAGSADVFQTTNPIVMPDPARTFSAAWFERAVVSVESMSAVDELERFQGKGNVWFVGSYASHGIPLLEGCVESAARVLEGIVTAEKEGLRVYRPWKEKRVAAKEGGFVVAIVVALAVAVLVVAIIGAVVPFSSGVLAGQ